MDEAGRIVGALWSLYMPEIASGHAVYFCFSQDSVREALKEIGIVSDSPIKVICDAARQCFDISTRQATLRKDALVRRAEGRSMAIVLVCQQVLAVETMIDDGRVSRNAYFPRLRELMSSQLPRDRQCPLSAEEFVQIWRTFQQEIESCEGCTDATVTFQFERYTGSNKTRGFPFSQALLSRADLLELQQHARRDRLVSRRGDEAWREVRAANRYLSRRAQKLVSEGSLHEEILEQVRQFLERSPTSSANAPRRSETKTFQLGIGIDPDDLLSERFFAFVQRKGSSTPIHDEAVVRDKLTDLLPGGGYTFCPPSDTDEYWVVQDRDVKVSAGRSFVIVARGFGMQHARAVLDGLIPPLPVPEECCRALGQSADIRVCRVELPQGSNLEITFRGGRIGESRNSVSTVSIYEWLGGVCVDLRARKYLREALPDAVRFGPIQFAISDLVGVGDRDTSWRELKKRLDALQTDATLDLSYPNGSIARLSIATMPRSAPVRAGFLINLDGTIAPQLQLLDEGAHAVVGYSELAPGVRPASMAELAALVRDMRDRKRNQYSADEHQALCSRVQASRAPSVLKGLILEFLMSGPSPDSM